MAIVATYVPVLEEVAEVLSELDVILSFAEASSSACIPYLRPTILPMGSGVLTMPELRHPCLEAQDSIAFISNDVDMKKSESNFVIVSGPNMGGKSTYIRSVAASCCLHWFASRSHGIASDWCGLCHGSNRLFRSLWRWYHDNGCGLCVCACWSLRLTTPWYLHLHVRDA